MKYLIFCFILVIFSSTHSYSIEYQRGLHLKQLECFKPFVQDKFFTDNWNKILAWSKDYKEDFKRFGVQRFFIRPHEGNLSHLPTREKWGGFLFKDSNYDNAKWYFELERLSLQYIPRKLSNSIYKTPYEFSLLRTAINKMNSNLSPHGWRLTTPVSFSASIPPLILFWGGAYMGVEALGDSLQKYYEKKEVVTMIENDYRYQYINRMLEDEVYDEELAILKAMELRGVYNLYFDTLKSFLSEGHDSDDPELTKFFLANEDVMAIFSPIFNRVYGYSVESFWNNDNIDYTKDKGLDFSKMHKLMLIAQSLVISHVRLESYLDDWEAGLNIDHYKMDSYLKDEFVNKVLTLREESIPLSKIKFWLMKDLDNQARMAEYDILGVRYHLPKDLGTGYFDLDVFRAEILRDIEETMK